MPSPSLSGFDVHLGSPGLSAMTLCAFWLLIPACPLPAQSAADSYAAGMAAMRSRDYPQAVSHLRQAIELDPGLAKAQGALGTLYFQLGQLELAEGHLQRALALDP